jgi:hypothetical protein
MNVQTQNDLEGIAMESFNDGMKIIDEDTENARDCFAMAWGFYMQFENTELMKLCERVLRSTGLDKNSMKPYKNKGFHTAGKGIVVYEYLEHKHPAEQDWRSQ